MLLRSFFAFSVAAMFVAGVHAEPIIPEVPTTVGPVLALEDGEKVLTETGARAEPSRPAKVGIVFSGAQREQFVFHEMSSGVVPSEKMNLTVVGSGSMAMGARIISTDVLREEGNRDMFHVRAKTGSGGVLSTKVLLTPGKEASFAVKGGLPTTLTIRRIE